MLTFFTAVSTVQSGTATSPDNFQDKTEIVNFVPKMATATVDITLPDNSVVEGDSTFTVMLSIPIEGVLSTSEPTTAEVTIVDNEGKL